MEECFSCGGGDFAQKTRENIEKFGVSVVGTQIPLEDGMLSMTYSIGITSTLGAPEVIMFGVPAPSATVFINMYYQGIKSGKEYKPGIEYDEFAEGFGMKFKKISTQSYEDHLIQASEFNIQNNVGREALQMIFPDKFGRWPEDPMVDERNVKMLHLLD